MKVLVFDVNETLLDLRALDKGFIDLFGDAAARGEWFNLLLQRAFTATLTGAYRDFTALARSALKMVAARRKVPIDEAKIESVLALIKTLPPHPDVPAALQTLHEAGIVMVALTQSTAATLDAQLTNADLKRFFTRLFSANAVKRYKPDSAAYRMVASEMQCDTADLRLIAAHAWDVEGAMRAGCKAAFVARPGQVLDPECDRPDIIGADLGQVAIQILGTEGAAKN
jgi:2-haloacid dehalogenase